MGSGESLHAVETVILLLLVLVAVFAAVARRLKVPYPIVLVLAGLVISFVPRMPRVPLDPNIVFVIFLPPLLFASAWAMSWREFRRNAVVIGLLAVGLVGFTVWGVAEFSDRFITALDWKAGFLLGAVISTTDAIAATSIAKTLGLPRRIVDILEGERCDGFAGAGDWARHYGSGRDADRGEWGGAADFSGGGWVGDWVVDRSCGGLAGEIY